MTILGPRPTNNPEKPASFASLINFDVALPGPPSPLLIWERRVSPGCEMTAAAIPWVVKDQSQVPFGPEPFSLKVNVLLRYRIPS